MNQVPREDNAEADASVNLGSSLSILLETRIPITHIMIMTIKDPYRRPDDHNEHDQTTNLEAIGDLDPQPPHHDPDNQGLDPNIQDLPQS